jgi:ATP-binding cassette subfamily B protein
MLIVTRHIIDAIYIVTSHHTPLPVGFWGLVALQFAMASMMILFARLVEFCDTALNERYTRHVNMRIMRHAATFDLSSFEDPQFYDRLERARVQGADRVGMIQESGVLVQQVITTVTLAAGICVISPWILIALIVCIVPEFLVETKFAYLGYSLSVGQTPARREMDYLRLLGTSKETAKEQKLFGLGEFFTTRYESISKDIYNQNVELGKRKLMAGSLWAVLGTVGYYGTYAYGIYLTISG